MIDTYQNTEEAIKAWASQDASNGKTADRTVRVAGSRLYVLGTPIADIREDVLIIYTKIPWKTWKYVRMVKRIVPCRPIQYEPLYPSDKGVIEAWLSGAVSSRNKSNSLHFWGNDLFSYGEKIATLVPLKIYDYENNRTISRHIKLLKNTLRLRKVDL